jgi:G:T-mismatch repair DNA endonuclease (very short patch repair protein)
VSDDWPLPVESDYERRTAILLNRLGLPFRKPVFASDDGLRPDFVLPKHRVFIEVQGIDDDEYRQHKAEMHREIARRYPSWRLVTWNPNEAEGLEVLEERLRNSVGKIT